MTHLYPSEKIMFSSTLSLTVTEKRKPSIIDLVEELHIDLLRHHHLFYPELGPFERKVSSPSAF
jgi:hypothetical protein